MASASSLDAFCLFSYYDIIICLCMRFRANHHLLAIFLFVDAVCCASFRALIIFCGPSLTGVLPINESSLIRIIVFFPLFFSMLLYIVC